MILFQMSPGAPLLPPTSYSGRPRPRHTYTYAHTRTHTHRPVQPGTSTSAPLSPERATCPPASLVLLPPGSDPPNLPPPWCSISSPKLTPVLRCDTSEQNACTVGQKGYLQIGEGDSKAHQPRAPKGLHHGPEVSVACVNPTCYGFAKKTWARVLKRYVGKQAGITVD